MVMRRWYDEIAEMVPGIVLDPPFAKRMIEKALLRAGKVAASFVDFIDPRELNPLRSGPITRRVQQPIPIGGTLPKEPRPDSYYAPLYLNEVTTWNKPVGSSFPVASSQVNHDVFDFSSYSQGHRPPVGSCVHLGDYDVLSPSAGKSNSWYLPSLQVSHYNKTPFPNEYSYEVEGYPYATGNRDPFPFGEDAPLYFQADLTQCNYVDFFVILNDGFDFWPRPRWGVDSPYAEPEWMFNRDNESQPYQRLDKILLKLKCSLDGGQTWEPPYYKVGNSEPTAVNTGSRNTTNTPIEYYVPSFTHPPFVNEAAQWGTMWLNRPPMSNDSRASYGPTYIYDYTGTYPYTSSQPFDPKKSIPYGIPYSTSYKELPAFPYVASQNASAGIALGKYLRPELLEHDDVLFKIVMEAPDNAYVQFSACGITYSSSM